jgi:branched-chain amino acid transport system ATP-binding protein
VLLKLQGLSIRFGGVAALSDVSFEIEEGRVTGLIGPNGAGKTTCFNCITRLYQPTSGSITFAGDDLLRVPAHRIAGRGIARTFQNLELFKSMTVLDNVLVGISARPPSGATHQHELRDAHELLAYVGLADAANAPVRSLPFGARKMVELARALATKPKLLLLDEPAAGFGHEEVGRLSEVISRVNRDFGTTILMVEHQMQLVMGVCDHIVVLSSGRKLAEGSPTSIAQNKSVIEAYLGTL